MHVKLYYYNFIWTHAVFLMKKTYFYMVWYVHVLWLVQPALFDVSGHWIGVTELVCALVYKVILCCDSSGLGITLLVHHRYAWRHIIMYYNVAGHNYYYFLWSGNVQYWARYKYWAVCFSPLSLSIVILLRCQTISSQELAKSVNKYQMGCPCYTM